MGIWGDGALFSLGPIVFIIIALLVIMAFMYLFKPHKGLCPVCDRKIRMPMQIRSKCPHCTTMLIRKKDGSFVDA